MNIRLEQKFGLKERLEFLLDTLIEKIIDISDFMVCKSVTWLEAGLFAFAAFRAAWFIVFGVENANYSYLLSDNFWTTIFSLTTLIHFGGFFLKTMCMRVTAAYLYAFIWFGLCAIAAFSRTTAPAVPHHLALTILSVVLVVRLSHEHKENEQ